MKIDKYDILKEYEEILMKIEDMIGTKSTNNIELEKIGENLYGERFIGVFSADEFPKYVKENQMFIINTEPKNKPGIHWVSCYKLNKKFYMYDSFDRPIKDLSKFWKHKNNIVNANKDRDQSFLEYTCGQRSIAWLIMFNKYDSRIINII